MTLRVKGIENELLLPIFLKISRYPSKIRASGRCPITTLYVRAMDDKIGIGFVLCGTLIEHRVPGQYVHKS